MQTIMGTALKKAGLVNEKDEARAMRQHRDDVLRSEKLLKEEKRLTTALEKVDLRLKEVDEAKSHAKQMLTNLKKQKVRSQLVGNWESAFQTWQKEEAKAAERKEKLQDELLQVLHELLELSKRL